jgi:hypothetical protein
MSSHMVQCEKTVCLTIISHFVYISYHAGFLRQGIINVPPPPQIKHFSQILAHTSVHNFI